MPLTLTRPRLNRPNATNVRSKHWWRGLTTYLCITETPVYPASNEEAEISDLVNRENSYYWDFHADCETYLLNHKGRPVTVLGKEGLKTGGYDGTIRNRLNNQSFNDVGTIAFWWMRRSTAGNLNGLPGTESGTTWRSTTFASSYYMNWGSNQSLANASPVDELALYYVRWNDPNTTLNWGTYSDLYGGVHRANWTYSSQDFTDRNFTLNFDYYKDSFRFAEFMAWNYELSNTDLQHVWELGPNGLIQPPVVYIPRGGGGGGETLLDIDGTAAVTSSWTADLLEFLGIDGTSAITSSWTADLLETLPLDGTVAITSSWTGDHLEFLEADGISAITSSWTGDHLEFLGIDGTSAIVSDWQDVGLETLLDIDGTSAITSSWTGDHLEFLEVDGTSAFTSSWSAEHLEYLELDGTSATLSSWTGDLLAWLSVDGTAAIVSSWVDGSTEFLVDIDGTGAIVSTWSGEVSAMLDVDGTSAITSSWSGDHLEYLNLDGNADAESDWNSYRQVQSMANPELTMTGNLIDSYDVLFGSLVNDNGNPQFEFLDQVESEDIPTGTGNYFLRVRFADQAGQDLGVEVVALSGGILFSDLDVQEGVLYPFTGHTSGFKVRMSGAGGAGTVTVDRLQVFEQPVVEYLGLVGSATIVSDWSGALLETIDVLGICAIISRWSDVSLIIDRIVWTNEQMIKPGFTTEILVRPKMTSEEMER